MTTNNDSPVERPPFVLPPPPSIPDKASAGEKSQIIADWLANPKFRFYAEDIDNVPLYMYDPNTGIWHEKGKHFVAEVCEKILIERFQKHIANEVVARLCARSFRGTTPTYNLLGGPPNKIVVLNGVLNLDTGKLEDYDPDDHHLARIPVRFNPKEECPDIKQFFGDVFLDKDLNAVEELIGYCLRKDYAFGLIAVLVGEGANGKSTFLRLLTSFLGQQNVSTESLFDLAYDRFAKSNLYGKLANIPGDLQNTPIEDTGTLKNLTGGDYVKGERKYFQAFNFHNFAKLIFACNKAPEIPPSEDTNAIWRRIVVFEFPNQFLKDDPKTDPFILEKITTPKELSGLLNLAIQGYRRMMRSGGLSNTKSLESAREDYLKHSSITTYFIKKFLDYSQTASAIPKGEVYELYMQCVAARKGKISPDAPSVFGTALKKSLPNVVSKQVKVKGKPVWHYLNLEIYRADLRAFIDSGGDVTGVTGVTGSPSPRIERGIDIEGGRGPPVKPVTPSYPDDKDIFVDSDESDEEEGSEDQSPHRPETKEGEE